jgi:hypothetical protein
MLIKCGIIMKGVETVYEGFTYLLKVRNKAPEPALLLPPTADGKAMRINDANCAIMFRRR